MCPLKTWGVFAFLYNLSGANAFVKTVIFPVPLLSSIGSVAFPALQAREKSAQEKMGENPAF